MKLSTTTADFRIFCGNNHIEAIRHLYDAGFRYIDLSMSTVDKEDALLVCEDWREEAGRLKRFAEELGMQFVQAHSPCFSAYDPKLNASSPMGAVEDYEINLKWQIRSIQVCKELGIPNIVVHPRLAKYPGKEAFFEENRKFYRELIPVMEETGVNVLTENAAEEDILSREAWWDKFMPVAGAELKSFVEYLDHPLFHACWDIAHRSLDGNRWFEKMRREGKLNEEKLETSMLSEDRRKARGQYEDLLALGEDLYGLHVADNRGPGHGHVHLVPFCGIVNFDDIMNGLIDCGYKGYFNYEACGTLRPAGERRKFDRDERLLMYPLQIGKDIEKHKYQVGKYILEQYDCFEG